MTDILWYDVIPSYMEYYNDYYNDSDVKNGNRYHLLFVEGKSDCDFYYNLFNYLEDNNICEDISILKRCIMFDFTNQFKPYYANSHNIVFDDYGISAYIEDGELDDESFNKDIDAKKEKFNNLYKSVILMKTREESSFLDENGNLDYSRRYENWKFVVECMNSYHMIKEKHIDCFGIIDYDQGYNIKSKDIIKNEDNITTLISSQFQDRETTFLRFFLKDYVNSKLSASDKKDLIDILVFTTKQGILAKTSYDISERKDLLCKPSVSSFNKIDEFNDFCGTMIKYSKRYFDKTISNSTGIRFRNEINLSFDDYLNEPSGVYVNSLGSSKRTFKDNVINNLLNDTQRLSTDTNNKRTLFSLPPKQPLNSDIINFVNGLLNEFFNIYNCIFNDFCSNVLGCSNDENSFNIQLKQHIESWLNDYNTTEKVVTDKVIDNVFLYTNGHYLLQRLLINENTGLYRTFLDRTGSSLFAPADKLKDRESKLFNSIVDFNNYSCLNSSLNSSPLKEYVHYRNSISSKKNIIVLSKDKGKIRLR